MLLCVQHTAYSQKKHPFRIFWADFFVAGNLLSAITPRSAAPGSFLAVRGLTVG